MRPAFVFGNLGLPELLIILFILVLLFGAKRLPELARSLGQSIRAFKEGTAEAKKLEDKPSSPHEGAPPS
ncbi:Sec-independent protein translocase protein TatA [bacterium HR10]|jgi:sec-independent protein translocase protein TatA|nr:Sec-independent protein translocase protein TatA [bacterium HR10]